MVNQNLARGLFLAAVALAFGLGAFRYPIGTLAQAGPGLFPLVVSCFLLAIAATVIVRSFYTEPVKLDFLVRNIAYVLGSLVAFVIVSEHLGAIAGTIALVFIAALAGETYSWKTNAKVAAVLIIIAIGFKQLFGLNLRLY